MRNNFLWHYAMFLYSIFNSLVASGTIWHVTDIIKCCPGDYKFPVEIPRTPLTRWELAPHIVLHPAPPIVPMALDTGLWHAFSLTWTVRCHFCNRSNCNKMVFRLVHLWKFFYVTCKKSRSWWAGSSQAGSSQAGPSGSTHFANTNIYRPAGLKAQTSTVTTMYMYFLFGIN